MLISPACVEGDGTSLIHDDPIIKLDQRSDPVHPKLNTHFEAKPPTCSSSHHHPNQLAESISLPHTSDRVSPNNIPQLLAQLLEEKKYHLLLPTIANDSSIASKLAPRLWHRILFHLAKLADPYPFWSAFTIFAKSHKPNAVTYTIVMLWKIHHKKYDELDSTFRLIKNPDSKAAQTYLLGLLQGSRIKEALTSFFAMIENGRPSDSINANFLLKRLSELYDFASIQRVLLAMAQHKIHMTDGTWASCSYAIKTPDQLSWIISFIQSLDPSQQYNPETISVHFVKNSPLFSDPNLDVVRTFTTLAKTFRPTLATFTALLQLLEQRSLINTLGIILCTEQRPAESLALIKAIAKYPYAGIPGYIRSDCFQGLEAGWLSLCEHYIQLYQEQGLLVEAASIVFANQNIIFKFSPTILGNMICSLYKAGNLTMAVNIFTEWLSNSAGPYFPTAPLKGLVRSLHQRGMSTAIAELLKLINEKHCQAYWKFTIELYSTALVKCADKAYELYLYYRDQGCPQELLDISDIIYAYLREGNISKAQLLLQNANESNNAKPRSIQILDLYSSAFARDATNFFSKLLQFHTEGPETSNSLRLLETTFYSIKTHGCNSQLNVDQIINMPVDIIVAFMTLLWKTLGPYLALHAFAKQLAANQNFTPNQQFLRTWCSLEVELVGSAQNTTFDYDLFHSNIAKIPEPPCVALLGNLIKLATLDNNPYEFEKIFKLFISHRLNPNMNVYESLLTWYKHTNSLPLCISVYESMEQAGFSATSTMFEGIIETALRQNNIDIAKQWVSKACEKKVSLNVQVATDFFNAAYAKYPFEECLAIIQAFEQAGTCISSQIYVTYLELAIKTGNAKWADRFLRAVAHKNCSLAPSIIHGLLNVYLEQRNFEKLNKILMLARRQNVMPFSSMSLYEFLTNTLAKTPNIINAAFAEPILPSPMQLTLATTEVITFASRNRIRLSKEWCHRVLENCLFRGNFILANSLHMYMTSLHLRSHDCVAANVVKNWRVRINL